MLPNREAAMTPDRARLYLITPPVAEARAIAAPLEAALDAGDIACVLLRLRARDDGEAKKIIRACNDIAQPRGAALLVEADAGPHSPGVATRANADGVHFARGLSPDLPGALKSFQPERIVGIGGLKSKDDAMNAGEAGVDYLMFGEPAADGYVPGVAQTLERAAWWAEIFNVPCVAYAHRLPDVAALSGAGVDFVALGEAVWSDPRGPAAAVREAQMLLQPLPAR